MTPVTAPSKKIVRVGNAGGYWGDDPGALRRQVLGPSPPDFVTADFLAEITMGILQKQRVRDPAAGYARDFVDQLAPLLGAIRQREITVITNAGGVNPEGCAQAVLEAARREGLGLTVAVVDGDDLLPRMEELRAAGFRFDNLETEEPLESGGRRLLSAHAYLGAEPVVRALAHQPDVVVTGRVTDPALTLAAFRHAFGWEPTDWDRIAAGIVAGHLLECGAQATGGNFTDWQRVSGIGAQGFPIVEGEEDGRFVLTKQPGTGGLVSPAVVKEQLLYELGDPECYLCPDAVVDFSGLTAETWGRDRVRVEGARGAPPPLDLKVSASVAGGFTARASLVVGGPDAAGKTEVLEEAFRGRLAEACAAAGVAEPEELRFDLVGRNAAQRGLSGSGLSEPAEGLVRLAAWSPQREPLLLFRKLAPSFLLSGPPGLAVTGGAPKVSEVIGYWPALIPREFVPARVRVLRVSPGGTPESIAEEEVRLGEPTEAVGCFPSAASRRSEALDRPRSPAAVSGREVVAPLGAVAHARSGDKGNSANIGVIGRSEACYRWLTETLTVPVVAGWADGVAAGPVKRYELPGLRALNFVFEGALGGGGTRSLLLDPQGKTLAQGLLQRQIRLPAALLDTIAPEDRPVSPAFAVRS